MFINAEATSFNFINPQLTFHLAKQKHLSWKYRFTDFLNGNSVMKTSHIISPSHCECGKWIASEKIVEVYGYIPEVQKLENEHKKLHELAKNVFEAKEKGDESVMMDEYRQMLHSSNKVVTLIELITNNLQNDAN